MISNVFSQFHDYTNGHKTVLDGLIDPIPVKWVSYWHLPAISHYLQHGFPYEIEQPDWNWFRVIFM